ncbi:hypothetical protein COL99_08460 [Bacillus toyonensis]|uniref:hypothetical protein n=1 Tax=Bacillus cereus group TaxID=86661 RepID=UPI000B41A406|nr:MULTISPECIES: hypothetical protein [Bacillus cereus group]MEB9697768.1 hypothetical protein [Bacillus cereus]ARX66041.1 hypothetical protein BVH75_08285 [Bacillus thuringiensis]PEF14027.1 hypothetical protein CON23_03050 [Bacillus thuringiensis]PGC14124.1 hypothetical protein COL99_08460 [Bacillus toyonensis]PGC72708.1 hypothetical protein COM28_27050 [Bacillus toyonensis]
MTIALLQEAFKIKVKGQNAKKRLIAISDYLYEHFSIEMSTNAQAEIYLQRIIQLIRDHPEEESNLIDDLLNILTDRYSNGEPYFLSSLSTTVDAINLHNSLVDLLGDNTLSYDSFDFKMDNHVFDQIKNTVNIRLRYTEWFINNVTKEREREMNSGNITLHFDINNKLCMSSHVGYSKVFSHLTTFICSSLTNISIKPAHIQIKAKTMKNASLSSFAPITLLTIYLIFKEMHSMGFIVDSVDSLNFHNEKAPRVKNARLGGNDLLDDPDVITKIHSGDKITRFTISIKKINTYDDNIERAVTTKLTVDFRGVLKFNFGESEFHEDVMKKVCLDLYQGIINSLESENTVEESVQLIQSRIMNLNRYTNALFSSVMTQVRENLLELFTLDETSQTKITSYFRDKHNME